MFSVSKNFCLPVNLTVQSSSSSLWDLQESVHVWAEDTIKMFTFDNMDKKGLIGGVAAEVSLLNLD